MKTKHIDGPWKYHLGRGANPKLHVQTLAGYQIASSPELSQHPAEQKSQRANIKLIAAAPDMLIALQHFADIPECYCDANGACFYCQARSAVEKATNPNP